MNDDLDLDARLSRALSDPPLERAPFVPRVLAALERRARRRRALLRAALGVLGAGVGIGTAYGPAWTSSVAQLTLTDAMATLALTAICCVVWVATSTPGSAHVLALPATRKD